MKGRQLRLMPFFMVIITQKCNCLICDEYHIFDHDLIIKLQEVIFIFRFLDQKKGAFTHSFLLNFYIKNNHIFA